MTGTDVAEVFGTSSQCRGLVEGTGFARGSSGQRLSWSCEISGLKAGGRREGSRLSNMSRSNVTGLMLALSGSWWEATVSASWWRKVTVWVFCVKGRFSEQQRPIPSFLELGGFFSSKIVFCSCF